MQNEITTVRDLVTQKIHESQIINSGRKRDAFRYLMEDTDESLSENNIEVLGIVDFPSSPHQINKKAYPLKLLFEKGSPNQYRSRLGFNLYKLPVGYYTLVVEWFPPEMNELSVTPQATTISISNYATKTFEKYTKTVINFHRWGSSPPQFLYLDLHGTVSNPSFLTIGHLIVYGVDPSVYDTAFVIENGKMVMQTDLSLNGHNLSGSVHRINGFHNKKDGNGDFSLNGFKKIIMNKSNVLLKAKIIYETNRSKYNSISLFLKKEDPNDSTKSSVHRFNSTDIRKKEQNFDINHDIGIYYVISMFFTDETQLSHVNENLLLLVEYK